MLSWRRCILAHTELGWTEFHVLLEGLRQEISFSSFVIAVRCVLFCPALEVVILAEQQLQGFDDHVGRRSIDELSVQLQLRLYGFFDSGLDGYGLWLFWWRFQNG